MSLIIRINYRQLIYFSINTENTKKIKISRIYKKIGRKVYEIKLPSPSERLKQIKKTYLDTTLILGKLPPFPPEPASILIASTPLFINTFFTAKALLLFNLRSFSSEKPITLI